MWPQISLRSVYSCADPDASASRLLVGYRSLDKRDITSSAQARESDLNTRPDLESKLSTLHTVIGAVGTGAECSHCRDAGGEDRGATTSGGERGVQPYTLPKEIANCLKTTVYAYEL